MDECKPLPSAIAVLLNAASTRASMYRRNLNLKATFESGSSIVQFQALSSRRFQRGFDRVNLHRPTSMDATRASCEACSQGLTLVHFSVQRKRFLWNRGCI